MKTRCLNPKATGYSRYGGAGVKICKRWEQFENFLADMGERPVGYSLERLDRTGDYTPENCCWATPQEQSINRGITVWVEIDGQTKHLSEWCREFGISTALVYWRVKQGMTYERAIKTPVPPNKSGYKGVDWHAASQLWRVRLRRKGKLIYSGYFKQLEDAVAARLEAERLAA